MKPKFIDQQANHQDLLKLIAVISMIIDHTGLFFFPQNVYLRVLGRLAMPLFCFFAGYNFKQRLSIKNLLGAIFLFLFPILTFGLNSFINMLTTIFLGQCYLLVFRNQLKNFNHAFFHLIFLAIIWSWSICFKDYLFISDYGTFGVAIMVMGYYSKNNLNDLNLSFGLSLILAFIYACQTLWIEANYFELKDLVLVLILYVILYLFFNLNKLSELTPINFRFLTRHTLSIYLINLVIYQMIIYRNFNPYIQTIYTKIMSIY